MRASKPRPASRGDLANKHRDSRVVSKDRAHSRRVPDSRVRALDNKLRPGKALVNRGRINKAPAGRKASSKAPAALDSRLRPGKALVNRAQASKVDRKVNSKAAQGNRLRLGKGRDSTPPPGKAPVNKERLSRDRPDKAAHSRARVLEAHRRPRAKAELPRRDKDKVEARRAEDNPPAARLPRAVSREPEASSPERASKPPRVSRRASRQRRPARAGRRARRIPRRLREDRQPRAALLRLQPRRANPEASAPSPTTTVPAAKPLHPRAG